MKKSRPRPSPPSAPSAACLELLDAMTASSRHLLTLAQLLAAAAHTGLVDSSLAARAGDLLYQEAEQLEDTLLAFRRELPKAIRPA